MCKILCSTEVLIGMPNNRNYKLLKPLSEKLLCDGFKFMMFNSWYDTADEITDYMQNKISEALCLLAENIVCNAENLVKHWCELVECYSGVNFVFDTKMAAFHQHLRLLYSEE